MQETFYFHLGQVLEGSTVSFLCVSSKLAISSLHMSLSALMPPPCGSRSNPAFMESQDALQHPGFMGEFSASGPPGHAQAFL